MEKENISVYVLVPTRVGMILTAAPLIIQPLTCPHTRGDDPKAQFFIFGTLILSPHAWG